MSGVDRAVRGSAGFVPASAHEPPSVVRWMLLCAAAETVGMTAAAAAARTSQALVGEPSSRSGAAVAVSLAVAGGLVEGVALGAAQSAGLARWLPALSRRGWVLVTTAVAGLGWAAASLPAVLGGGDGTGGPPLLLVVAGAAGLGAVMGALLGAAQALVLRGHVAHPRRWAAANALAWPGAMVVIFLGATSPSADWSTPAVVGLGAATGLVAGAVLGLVSGWFLPSLTGPAPHNRVVLALLQSSAHGVLDRSLVGLRLRGVRSGRWFRLPVMFATDPSGLVVVPGRPETKRWWRNLRRPAEVDVLRDGTWCRAHAELLPAGGPEHDAALEAYRRRWPRAKLPDAVPVVRIRLGALPGPDPEVSPPGPARRDGPRP